MLIDLDLTCTQWSTSRKPQRGTGCLRQCLLGRPRFLAVLEDAVTDEDTPACKIGS